MRIAFTGHRDRTADAEELYALASEFPDATWVHGDANGFDKQVWGVAELTGIPQVVIRPDYTNHPPKQAPLIRNHEIIKGAALLVACYDGRKGGGTAYTIRIAREAGIEVRVLEARG